MWSTGSSTTSGNAVGARHSATVQPAGPLARRLAACRFPYSPVMIAKMWIEAVTSQHRVQHGRYRDTRACVPRKLHERPTCKFELGHLR